ncbi:MAG TPA: L,D-transpeptidase [Polyangiaceae bacterium]|nr:L,D-transpeptidase [Polyangiaceae bacterium]
MPPELPTTPFGSSARSSRARARLADWSGPLALSAGLLATPGCNADADPTPAVKAEQAVFATAAPEQSAPATAAPVRSVLLSGSPTIVASSQPSVRSPAPATDDGPRVFAKTRFVWVRERAEWSSQWIGYLWPGESVKLASKKPIYARGCEAWYAVEPRGYVCVDGRRATLDRADPELATLARVPLAAAPPHRYAESLGVQRYEKLPDRAEQLAREPDLEQHLAFVDAARNGGAVDASLDGVDLSPATRDAVEFAKLPIDLQVPRNALRRDSTIAFLDEYRHDGRSFLLTTDLAWVPKDRVRPYDSVTFQGAHLDQGVRLPLAFFRERERPAYERGSDGHLAPSRRKFARLAWVELTGATEAAGEGRYLETREPGLWALESDCVVPTPAATTPWGAPVSEAPPSSPPEERKPWIEASVNGGWLIAYENARPVFVTLAAPGRGGAKRADARDLMTTSSTPLGTFPITGKFVTATMDGPDELVHSDVPWVQNFRSAHAIHSAYWHDAWGERVSGGCLNVSPADGRYLFGFTLPEVPDGWHGVRWDPHLGPTTTVIVHR